MQNSSHNVIRTKEDWPDETIYFLTDSTFLHFPYFDSYEKKLIVLEQIKKIKKDLGIPVSAYSIAINHYHLKFYLKRGKRLTEIKRLLRGGITYEYKKRYSIPYNEMWQTRKILRINSHDIDWRVTGYIIGNLIKHKEVSTFQRLKENIFSSYGYMADKYGDEEIEDLVRTVIAIEEDSWGRTDIINFESDI